VNLGAFGPRALQRCHPCNGKEGAPSRERVAFGWRGERRRHCQQGASSRGVCAVGNGHVLTGRATSSGVLDAGARVGETRRTPGSVAGCNSARAVGPEETVEVVRNHEGGTRPPRWHEEAEDPAFRRRVGSGRTERRIDGGAPRGGDATRSTDGRSHEHPLAGRVVPASVSTAKSIDSRSVWAENATQSSQRARVVGRWQHGQTEKTWWTLPARAGEHHGPRRSPRAPRGQGKPSNARPATVKAKEGARKANDSLPCARRGKTHRSNPARLDTREPR
jgi:hypothetical protein